MTSRKFQNRRVLAVLAMYRRKVKGSIMGSSKLEAFISNQRLPYNILRNLAIWNTKNQEEIMRILKQLSNDIRHFLPLLKQYQHFLSDIDVIAKPNMQTVLTVFCQYHRESRLYFRDAYHPFYI
jgi:DNA mismatch repair protein MutS2